MHNSFPFSLKTYQEVLAYALSLNFQFISFDNIQKELSASDRYCVLRHDVDISIELALEMARAEAEMGISATYFVMLRSPIYNLLSRHASIALKEIISLGHEIGLHYDVNHPCVKENEVKDTIIYESKLLENIFQTNVRTFSYHQPSSELIERELIVDGLINTYSQTQMKGWFYISDSNRRRRKYDAFTVFSSGARKIQLLIHPMWWMCADSSTEGVWNSAIVSNFETMQHQFLETERAYGAKRKFVVEE